MADGKRYGGVFVEPIPGTQLGNFHLQIDRYTPSIANRMARDYDSLMGYLKKDYKGLLGIVDDSLVDIKLWKHFVRLWGFSTPYYVTYKEL